MGEDVFQRIRMLLGDDGMGRLHEAKVSVFGLGGVGSYVVEALARSGVGSFILVDPDIVAPSNINRQLIATCETMGQTKTEAEAARVMSINPGAHVETYPVFYGKDVESLVPWEGVRYAVDAVDTVTAKLFIAEQASAHNVPAISCMGTGNKFDPSKLRVADIFDTSVDPLARVVRRELRKRGVTSLEVVYSTEEPVKPFFEPEADAETRKKPPGSNAFVPGAAGLLIASVVVQAIARAGDSSEQAKKQP